MVGRVHLPNPCLFAVTARQGHYPAVEPAAGGLRQRQDRAEQQFQPICESLPLLRKCPLVDVDVLDLSPVSPRQRGFPRIVGRPPFQSSFSLAACSQASICPLTEVIFEPWGINQIIFENSSQLELP